MAQPAVETKRMTFEEAARLDPDEHSGEIEEGRWVPVAKNTFRHGEIILNVGLLLRAHARANKGWRVSGGDPGAKLRRNPDTLRGADVAMVQAERVPTGRGAEGWIEGAPDLAVEVIGDAQSISELTKKALEYLAAGGRMVWVLDPEPERVIVFTPPGQVRVLGKDDTLDGGELLPGFSCTVSELFE